MHRNDHATALPGGLHTEGDPAQGIPATVVTADSKNAVQEEIGGYIESRGIVLAKPDNTQLQQAIESHVRSEVTGGFRNLAINGTFRFWQRVDQPANGPFTIPTTDIDLIDVQHADRWYATSGGGGVATIDRGDFTVGQTDVPFEPKHFLIWDQTTGATTTDPALIQALEFVRVTAGQTVTISAEMRVTSGTLLVDADILQDFGSGGSAQVASASGQVSLNTTWQKVSFVIAVPSISGKTIGAQYDFAAPRIRFPQSQTFTVHIANFQVEIGTGASDFEVRTEADELRLCQRYFEKSNAIIDVPGDVAATPFESTFVSNYDGSADNGYAPISGIKFQAAKRHFGTGSGGPFFVFWDSGSQDQVNTHQGAAAVGGDQIDSVQIDRAGPTNGFWTTAVPGTGVVVCQASWTCDVEFGKE